MMTEIKGRGGYGKFRVWFNRKFRKHNTTVSATIIHADGSTTDAGVVATGRVGFLTKGR